MKKKCKYPKCETKLSGGKNLPLYCDEHNKLNGMKKCKICKIEKETSEFYSQGQGYFTSECKECKKKRNNEYDKKHLEQKRKRAREYERRQV